MGDQQQIVIRIGADGTIRAETRGVKGPRCLDYIPLLEDLLDAHTTTSSFTPEYTETTSDADIEVNRELHQW